METSLMFKQMFCMQKNVNYKNENSNTKPMIVLKFKTFYEMRLQPLVNGMQSGHTIPTYMCYASLRVSNAISLECVFEINPTSIRTFKGCNLAGFMVFRNKGFLGSKLFSAHPLHDVLRS